MKNYINKFLAILLFLEGFYFLYNMAANYNKFINSFDPSLLTVYVIVLSVYVISMVMFIASGVGVWESRRWSIICGWIAIILPQLLKLILPTARIPLNYNVTVFVINILILCYLSSQWRILKHK